MTESTATPHLDKRFIIDRQGKPFALFQGLLDLAHQMGLQGIETQLLQIADEGNNQTWIVRAVATMPSGTFSGMGDANTANVAPAMRTVQLRLCETRAVARALRFATNVGIAALEELSDDDTPQTTSSATVSGNGGITVQPGQPVRNSAPVRTVHVEAPPSVQPPNQGAGLATAAQIRAVYAIGRDKHQLGEGEIDGRSRDLFGALPAELTKRQASQFITSLGTGR